MRVLYSDNGVIKDVSNSLKRIEDGNFLLDYTAGQDFLYIGSDLPFNHFHIILGSVTNLVPASMQIQLWDGKGWIDTVEVIDQTDGLSNSGLVEFVPDKDEDWERESTNHKGEQVTGLTTVKIYDQYWARVKFTQTLTPGVELLWLGHLFNDDLDLYSEYPVFNSSTLKESFKAGKISWVDQGIRAAELLIRDLRAKQVIVSADQILSRDDYRLAAVSKTAQIIFQAMGDDYIDDVASAKREYEQRLDLSIHKIDTNQNAILDVNEKSQRVGFMLR